MNKTTALICVINNIIYDQRVQRFTTLLQKLGYHTIIYGRRYGLDTIPEKYNNKHFIFKKHLFNKKILFYAEYNIKLFLYLLSKKNIHLIVSNDLDTLLPCFLVSKIRGIKLIFDSHELFSESYEIQGKKFVKFFWRSLENLLLPKVEFGITVSDSIASEYFKRYKKKFNVLRNTPPALNPKILTPPPIPMDNHYNYLILQGTGINTDRGAEELVIALTLLPERFRLIIAGSGDIIETLQQIVKKNNLSKRVIFTGRLPYKQLMSITTRCFAGFSLDKPTCLNYRFSLPNKLFDYIQARIPVIVSQINETSKIVAENHIGLVVPEVTPQHIADAVLKLERLLNNNPSQIMNNLEKAATHYTRENEEKKILTALYDFLY